VSTAAEDPTTSADQPGQATAPARAAYHHGDLEQALVSEALAQVRSRGADAVSLRQVAQTVGVSPSAAYAHFPDKNALMAAVGHEGMTLLDARMVGAADSVRGDDDAAAIARFRATGEAYVGFAVDEPHLFRHVFGPVCALDHGKDPAHMEADSVSYQVLCRGLDDLEARGLLRPGMRDGLDLVAWTMVHGFASLVLDGFLAVDVGEVLIDALARLALSESAQVLLSR
jgi:AcrR family transcriptional regulator